jgi:hypothetical protein
MERPCERCKKKGVACIEGSHKKAKYMMEDGLNQVDDGFSPIAAVNQESKGPEGVIQSPSIANNLVALPSHSGDTIRNIYSQVTKPYPYSQNFNNLLIYISKRLDKDNIFRVCRAISYFRPSLIAVIKNLTEEDLLLKEKCCQRMLAEYKRILIDCGDPR